MAPKRILLAVLGLSPQVLTETIYALAHAGNDALPHEVHVLTTTVGAQRTLEHLLAPQSGWFHRLVHDYGLAPIKFDASTVHVLHDRQGKKLADIRSAEDNALLADQISDLVRTLTQDAASSLHVSLAGGRKSMAFFAGYALSLWGRPQDRLSHVLVSEPFESSPEFFYPSREPRWIQVRGQQPVDCSQAQVTLADIPFVRLRPGLASSLTKGRLSFAQAVDAAQTALTKPSLWAYPAEGYAVAGERRMELPPADLAFLLWMLERKQHGLPGLARPSSAEGELSYAADYLRCYERIRPRTQGIDRRYRAGMSQADFDERKSKVNKAFSDALGADAAWPYQIGGQGRPKLFELRLAAQNLFVKD
jgi:CRISPR-associated protein (TIGR02584 family)